MFGFIKKAFVKSKNFIGAGAVGIATMAITYTGGLVTFDAADNAAVDTGVSNTLTNLWAGFVFILPYLGTFLGIALVIGAVYLLVKKARS